MQPLLRKLVKYVYRIFQPLGITFPENSCLGRERLDHNVGIGSLQLLELPISLDDFINTYFTFTCASSRAAHTSAGHLFLHSQSIIPNAHLQCHAICKMFSFTDRATLNLFLMCTFDTLSLLVIRPPPPSPQSSLTACKWQFKRGSIVHRLWRIGQHSIQFR